MGLVTRDPALLQVGLELADDPVRHLLAGVAVLEGDGRAEDHPVARVLRSRR